MRNPSHEPVSVVDSVLLRTWLEKSHESGRPTCILFHRKHLAGGKQINPRWFALPRKPIQAGYHWWVTDRTKRPYGIKSFNLLFQSHLLWISLDTRTNCKLNSIFKSVIFNTLRRTCMNEGHGWLKLFGQGERLLLTQCWGDLEQTLRSNLHLLIQKMQLQYQKFCVNFDIKVCELDLLHWSMWNTQGFNYLWYYVHNLNFEIIWYWQPS